jgi:hypothetical protein
MPWLIDSVVINGTCEDLYCYEESIAMTRHYRSKWSCALTIRKDRSRVGLIVRLCEAERPVLRDLSGTVARP